MSAPASPTSDLPAEVALLQAALNHSAQGNTSLPPMPPGIPPEKLQAAALHLLAILRQNAGQLEAAETLLRQSLALEETPLTLHSLGVLLHRMKRWEGAEAAYRRAIALTPDYGEAYNNLGILYKDWGRPGEAEQAYLEAVRVKPEYPDPHNNLGVLYKGRGQLEAAEVAYRRALELRPEFPEALNNLGVVCKTRGQLTEAEAFYRRAVALRPQYAEAHNNLGVVYKETRRPVEAEAAYREALALRPDYADARWNLGLLLLSLGRYREAWPCYESRYHPKRMEAVSVAPPFPFPQLQRNDELAGKSLLIWPEQGYGDAIQFARFLPQMKALGVRHITLFCPPVLGELLATAPGADQVIWDGAQLTQHDYWAFSLSLPYYCHTSLGTLPAAPYLHAPAERLEAWRERLAGPGFKVGLVWKGNPEHKNDTHRSLPGLPTLAPLWEVPGTRFFSLQKGADEAAAAQPPAAQPLTALGGDIRDFADTAAILSQLDLVICVDTAVAHLAGALGKPCWLLLSDHDTDWRWLKLRNDSPWYPEVLRLFRQPEEGNWATVMAQVKTALTRAVAEKG